MTTRSWVSLALFGLAMNWAWAVLAEEPAKFVPPAVSASEYVPDPASVTREGSGYRYSQNGWIVVHIEGAPYERGYQHGKLLAAEIVDHIKATATARSTKSPADAWRDMRLMTGALFLRGYDAEYLEEMKGIADGAAAAGAKYEGRPLDMQDILALNSSLEVDFLTSGVAATATGLEEKEFRDPADGKPRHEDEDHCSAFAATGPATADGQIVFGHITMFSLYIVRHFNVWLDVQPKEGHRVVMQTYPGGIMSGLDYYMNDAGLLCCETTIGQTGFHAQGTPLVARIRRALQYADSIDKAVEILLTSNNGLYSNEWLLADTKTGEIASFELGTHAHKLWRSSKGEFPGGTTGFYWGCNNAKDLELRKETHPSLKAKPANLVFFPRSRDVKWLELYEAHKGKIDATFGFHAFTTPPLAAFSSCDAKFTTTALAKEMKSWALFGPPLGRTWDSTAEEARRLPDIQPLVSNDWTLISTGAPAKAEVQLAATDLAPFPKKVGDEESAEARFARARSLPPAWRGSLLPQSDADIWLAAAFADYEKFVAQENWLKKQAKGGVLDAEARERLETMLLAPQSRWLTAVRRLGKDLPLAQVKSQWNEDAWYGIASGKGVMLLASLRANLGPELFDKALDSFGREHAASAVSTAQFREHLEKAAGKSLAGAFDPWISGDGTLPELAQHCWSIDSFEVEPERALIVYGSTGDRAAQRETAELLQRKLVRRGNNFSIPIMSDTEASEDDLRSHHLLLVGRPTTNAITARLAEGLPIGFGAASFTVRDKTYAHADSAIVCAGENKLNSRFAIVVYAGLGARATRACVERLPTRGGEPAQALVMAAGLPTRAMRVSPPPSNTADKAAAK